MNGVRTVSLLLAVLSLVLAASGAFVMWGTALAPTQKAPDLGVSKIAEGITASSSCEKLQRVCPRLAAGFDAMVNGSRYFDQQFTMLFTRVTIGAIVWGLVCAAGFLYVFVMARKASEASK